MIKNILPLLLLLSCQPKQGSKSDETKRSLADSSFVALMDLNLQLQSAEFVLQKKLDSMSTIKFLEDYFLNSPEAAKLYNSSLKVYATAFTLAKRETDIAYYKQNLSKTQADWLNSRFGNKTVREIKAEIAILQKDAAIASAIINLSEPDEAIKQTEEQYKKLIHAILDSI